MKPIFQDMEAWERAQLLLQPIYIRVVDNIRKYLEQAGEGWVESFAEVQTPRPGYRLRLQRLGTPDAMATEFDLWALCFQVCFQHFPGSARVAPPPIASSEEAETLVEIDPSLFDEDDEVDWDAVDRKSMAIVQQALGSLLKG